jgi:hypothetical protein
MSTEEDKLREQGLKDFRALNAARGLIPLLPGELESKNVPKMHKDYLTKIIAGLVEDNTELKAENERLREAGSNLYSLAKILIYCLGDKEKDNPALDEWLAAKGVQS